MKLLELFSGTGSVGKVAKELGFDVVSLDLKNADISTHILQWDYKQFNHNEFQVIWASPPCTEYSIAKTTGSRHITYANALVQKTIEIINYFNPLAWFIENPQTGLLKHQTFMWDFNYQDVDYCKYGFPYRKRTRIWNNLENWKPRPLCKKDCNSIVNNKHKETAQRMPSGKKNEWGADYIIHTQDELYRIPPDLVKDFFSILLNEG